MSGKVNVRLDKETHKRLNQFKFRLMARRGKPFTLSEAVDEALKAAAYVLKSAEEAIIEEKQG